MKLEVLSIEGKKVSDIELNDAVFGIEPHQQAMFDAVIAQQSSLRQGTHAVKNRAAVRGGGRKPWAQKGTGRARQGTIRSPQWRGGGIVFGPNTNRNYKKIVNRKVRALALRSALSLKVSEGNLTVIDQISWETPSTKAAIALLDTLKIGQNKTLIVTQEMVPALFRSVSNLRYIDTEAAAGINILDLLHYTNLVVTTDAVKKIEEALA